MPIHIDLLAHPGLRFRIDSFQVPQAARPEFEVAMKRNLAFLESLPGFLGHVALEKSGGPSSFNLVTLAVWDSQESLDGAGQQVRAYYQRIGFDPAAMMARWGVRAELGNYRGPLDLQ